MQKDQSNRINDLPFTIGSRVFVKSHPAIVRYIGPIKRKKSWTKSIYVGVEFFQAHGNTNGMFEKNTYFTCKAKHGLFVQPKLVELNDSTDKTTVFPTESLTFGAWNHLDQLGERMALDQSKEMYLLSDELSRQSSDETDASHVSATRSKLPREIDPFDIALRTKIQDTYNGPRFDDKPNYKFAEDLLVYFRDNINKPLPIQLCAKILNLTENLLKKTVPSSVVEIEVPKSSTGRFVILGDTHGQLNDVLWIFFKFGLPSLDSPYLFNGDIADRGLNAVEIFLLIFAFKLACPQCVFLNRGNHESIHMNEVYGFGLEVCQKYNRTIYMKFQSVFNLLPLCTVLNNSIIIIHGGLLRDETVTLNDLKKMNHRRSCPASPITAEDYLIFDILWSDPQTNDGHGLSGRGSDCVSFGPDVTEKFLKRNNLKLCVRSHQVPKTLRGYDFIHNDHCLTLFSASNYCGTSGNFGGVMIFNSKLEYEMHEYMAPMLEEIQAVYKDTQWATEKIKRISPDVMKIVTSLEQKVQTRARRASIINIERDFLTQMSRLICENKPQLWDIFWTADQDKKGYLPLEEIQKCFDSLFTHPLPWDKLIQKLNVVNPDGKIYYQNFLNQFRIDFKPANAKHANWRLETIQHVFESMINADLTLREILLVLDRNVDGTVSYREFEELLRELKCGLSSPQVRLLMRIITSNYSTSSTDEYRVDVGEFLGRFKVVYDQIAPPRELPESKKWILDALPVIGKYILADKVEAAERYYMGHALLTFVQNPPNTQRRRSSALRSVALLQKFSDFTKLHPESNNISESERLQGYLSYNDFIQAIRQLPIDKIQNELKFQLTYQKLLELAEYVDKSHSKRINYLEFLNAFHAEDKMKNNNVAELLWQQICATFYAQKLQILSALHYFDPEDTGLVKPEHFVTVLETINVISKDDAPLSESQIDLIVSSIDCEKNELIDYKSFLDSFIIVDPFMDMHALLAEHQKTLAADESDDSSDSDD